MRGRGIEHALRSRRQRRRADHHAAGAPTIGAAGAPVSVDVGGGGSQAGSSTGGDISAGGAQQMPGAGGSAGTVSGEDSPPAGWTLTWSDEFDGDAGKQADPKKWKLSNGPSNVNNELEYYSNRTENSALDGMGHLLITSRREEAFNGRNYIVRKDDHTGPLLTEVRSPRDSRAVACRQRLVARVLGARQRRRRLAQMRRDRHHGNDRQPVDHQPRQPTRPGLFGRQPADRAIPL